jgi:glycerol transport system permease protein
MTPPRARGDNRAWLLMLPAMAVLLFVGVVPLVAVFNYSFHDIFSLDRIHWIGTGWYEDLVTSPRFHASLGRSLLFAGLVLAIQVPVGVAVARFLVRSGRLGKGMLLIFALPLVVPWNMIPMMWLNLIDRETGLLGGMMAAAGFDHRFTAWHTWALILVMDTWHWLGLVVILAYAGLASIPPAWHQAAAIDGASDWAVFRHIELPRIAGALAVVLLLRFIDSFMIYTEAFAINAGGPSGATTFLALDLGEEIKGFSYGAAAARSMLYFLIVLAVVWAFVVATRRTGRA